MIHSTVGVYLNYYDQRNRWKTNGVCKENLKEHIEYNKKHRFGRALFVDGKCVHQGYLSYDKVSIVEKMLEEQPVIQKKDTSPYR